LGGSAGALAPLQELLAALPPTGLALVVSLRLDPEPAVRLDEILAQTSSLPVRNATPEAPLEADVVYVLPQGERYGVGEVALHREGPDPRPTLDHLFRTLAAAHQDRAVAVVLSGRGSDGAGGARAVKDGAGLVLAQIGAAHPGLPASAIATGNVDHALTVTDLAAHLAAHARFLGGLSQVARDELAPSRPRLFEILQRTSGHDFSGYKPGTLTRRILRRMLSLGIDSPAAYVERLEADDQEAERLFRDLLIGVTQFFRDPAAFEALDRLVVPALFRDRHPEDVVRVWVAGCSTGEEAYSIAMLMLRAAEALPSPPPIQVFATDIDERALEVARLGRYSDALAEQVPASYLQQYFSRTSSGYRVREAVRSVCLFSAHNLTKDPPFSSLDLVSCRNLLIYLSSDLQRRLGPLFHYALRPGGYLFLGPSESLAGPPDLFETLDASSRIHRASARHPAAVRRVPARQPALDTPSRAPWRTPAPDGQSRAPWSACCSSGSPPPAPWSTPRVRSSTSPGGPAGSSSPRSARPRPTSSG
ncbi:MAG: CheR family methyltransferase, partial [Myxococcota bacterium]